MPTIAIIGAGPGLGIATARRFGKEGFSVVLIARNRDKLDKLAKELEADGIQARGYTADVQDPGALAQALDAAASELGVIDVVQYSPIPAKAFLKPVLDTTPEDLTTAAAFSIVGPAAVVQQVLPGFRKQGRGTILLVNGGSAVTPNGNVAGTSTAFAGESAYGQMLHEALAPENIHVGQLIIPGAIGGGDPRYDPDALADRLWNIHSQPRDFRVTVS